MTRKVSSHDDKLYKLPKAVPSVKPKRARKPLPGQLDLMAGDQEFSRKK
jgi:hypothetical protein